MKDRQKDYCCVCGKKFEPIELKRHRMHTQWYWCYYHELILIGDNPGGKETVNKKII